MIWSSQFLLFLRHVGQEANANVAWAKMFGVPCLEWWLAYVGIYTLVHVYISMENHKFVMGKSTISMAMFSSKLLVYQIVGNNREKGFKSGE